MKKFSALLVVLITLLCTVLAYGSQKQELESQIKQINTSISNKQYHYNLAEKKYITYTNQLRDLNAKVQVLEKKLRAQEENLKKLSAEIESLNKSIEELTIKLNEEKSKSSKALKAYYYFYNIEKYFPQGLYYEYMNKKIAHYLQGRIKSYMEHQVLLNKQKQELVLKKNNQLKLIASINEQKNAIAQQKNKIAVLAQEAARLKQAYINDIVYLQRQRNYLQSVLNKIIQEEIRRQEELKRQRELERQRLLKLQQYKKAQELKKQQEEAESRMKLENLHTGLRPPVEGVIVDNFGVKTNPVFNVQTRNDGIDIKAKAGSPIRAIAKGQVDYVGTIPGLGGVIIINHLNDYYSIYAHVNPNVSKGQMVNEGQIIGHLSGDILHFELRKGSVPVNPLNFINRRYLGG
ncbi:peptidoglycan DD-metalloendopeptidase family protein [Desulfurella sp.]|uniref:murein hydrolase activator EnvC family protein n=1 Tax=Desulfurella sp. TaxID=1962857 RepID=UPI0025BEA2F3|nr:peptidoglycan DD-metalloendopeptidase family protein [Desulfurella sp.]